MLTRAVKIKAFRLLLTVHIQPFFHFLTFAVNLNLDAAAILFAFSIKGGELVNELGEFVDVHEVSIAIVKDKGESIGMGVLTEPPPNAFESAATLAKTATHEGRARSLNGDVHIVQFNIRTYVVRSLVMSRALDTVVIAKAPFLIDAVVLGGGDFEVLDIDVFHVFVFLSFDVLSIHYKTGFVNYFFNCS